MTVLAEVLIEQPPALPPEADPAPDLLAAALSYAARGWRIFRLKPRDKSPLRSPGHHAATTNAETVRAWWAKSPEANIGHVPPLNVQVVDVDGPAGRATIASLSPPETVIAETGGGGWHYYYRLPAHVTARNMTKTGLPGVHLKAAPGGYLVAPPSVHPDTGQRYTWADGLAPGEVQIAPAPDWVLALLTAKPKREATSAPTPEHVNEREEIDGRADVSTDGLPLSIP